MNSQGVRILWEESRLPGATTQGISPFPRATAIRFSGLCASQLARGKSTIHITGGSFDHVRQVFRWIADRCHGVESLPSLGDKPFYNAFRLNEAARMLKVSPLADDLWKEIQRLQNPVTNTGPSPEDVKAVMAGFNHQDSCQLIVIQVLAAAISNGKVLETSTELVALKEKDRAFAEALSKLLVARQEWVKQEHEREEKNENQIWQRQKPDKDRMKSRYAARKGRYRDLRGQNSSRPVQTEWRQAPAEFSIGNKAQYDSEFPSLGK